MSAYQAPMVMRLSPSRIGRAALVATALLALAAIALADLPIHGQAIAALVVVALTLQAWRTSLPVALKLHPDGLLELRDAASPWQPVSLLARSTVSPWLCLLACRAEGSGQVRNLAILPDSLDADDFRQLRVWLRWLAKVEGADAGGDGTSR